MCYIYMMWFFPGHSTFNDLFICDVLCCFVVLFLLACKIWQKASTPLYYLFLWWYWNIIKVHVIVIVGAYIFLYVFLNALHCHPSIWWVVQGRKHIHYSLKCHKDYINWFEASYSSFNFMQVQKNYVLS